VGFAAKLERSNSIDRAWASKNIGISRHKSGGAALISEMPDTFQSSHLESKFATLWKIDQSP
jgi:hypothetical protein